MIYLSFDPKGWYVAYCDYRGRKLFKDWRSRVMDYDRALRLKRRIERAMARAGKRTAREVAKALPANCGHVNTGCTTYECNIYDGYRIGL